MPDGRFPLDAVAFTTSALLPPLSSYTAAGLTRPGARRLVTALAARGVRMAVVAGPDESSGAVLSRLTTLGFDPMPVLLGQDVSTNGGSQPNWVTQGRDLTDALAGFSSPERTLLITGPSDTVSPDAAARLAGTVVTTPDQPIAKPVLPWLSARTGILTASASLVAPLDEQAVAQAQQHHLNLTKPPGSLGRIEDLGIQLAGISGMMPPPEPYPASVAIFAADHGVYIQGVSPWPQEVTAQMVANFLRRGAAINVLAEQFGAEVLVVDVGVNADLPLAQGLLDRKIAYGTADLATGPAMTEAQAVQAMEVGAEVAGGLVAQGVRCLLTGDMGIANTTASAALTCALTGRRAGDITGPGAGLPDNEVPHKATIVAEAAARAREIHGDNPLGILAEVGGLEHAALVGYIIAGAALGVPVVVDGVIAASALLVASRLVPGAEASVIAGHRSAEPASGAILDTLGMEPVVDLGMRLGEGTGAALALPVLDASTRILAGMATFDEAGVAAG